MVAAVASLPFAYMLHYRLAEGFDLPRIALALNYALLIATMVVRRPPSRVTPRPLYWATAFLATYWVFMTLGLTDAGSAIAPTAVTHAIALASLAVALFARLSLGRNIGFVPAQRELVTSYAYSIVRHPIYAGLFLSLTGFVLRAYSPRNLLVSAIGAGLFIVKTFMEEDFLREDPAYARYMQRVRSRWIPGLA
ncbi:MAG TPA: methyltransferase [Candidatus Binatia bacterium]|nr:methyltransferase [Candidatus Binatia bacterium]